MYNQEEEKILEICQYINDRCQIDVKGFSIDILKSQEWYLEILSILCPYLEEDLTKIHELKNPKQAINQILNLINSLEEFNEDVTQIINGKEVVNGNLQHISYMVQIFHNLLQAAIKEEEGGDSEEEEDLDKSSLEKEQSKEMSRNQKEKKIRTYSREKSISDYESKEQSERHSVLGINNEFDKTQRQESEFEEEKKRSIEESKNQEHYSPFYQQKKQSSNEISQDPYLNQKMAKTLKKKKKRNPEKDMIVYGSKKPKKLVEHPSKGTTLKKAKSAEEIKLTRQVQGKIKEVQRQMKKPTAVRRARSPMNEEMAKKKRQVEYHTNDFRKLNKQRMMRKANVKKLSAKTDENLMKLLNWREEKIKRERKEYELAMKTKLHQKKEQYIKKVNDLVLKLEKEKKIQEKRDFKETLIKENNQAVRRMTSLEKWYRDQLEIMKDNKKQKRNQQQLLKTGHKEIVNQIQKQLKRENEKKLLNLTQQYRQEETNIINDFEELEDKIIKVYKKN